MENKIVKSMDDLKVEAIDRRIQVFQSCRDIWDNKINTLTSRKDVLVAQIAEKNKNEKVDP